MSETESIEINYWERQGYTIASEGSVFVLSRRLPLFASFVDAEADLIDQLRDQNVERFSIAEISTKTPIPRPWLFPDQEIMAIAYTKTDEPTEKISELPKLPGFTVNESVKKTVLSLHPSTLSFLEPRKELLQRVAHMTNVGRAYMGHDADFVFSLTWQGIPRVKFIKPAT